MGLDWQADVAGGWTAEVGINSDGRRREKAGFKQCRRSRAATKATRLRA